MEETNEWYLVITEDKKRLWSLDLYNGHSMGIEWFEGEDNFTLQSYTNDKWVWDFFFEKGDEMTQEQTFKEMQRQVSQYFSRFVKIVNESTFNKESI